jgi:hypothetical protein
VVFPSIQIKILYPCLMHTLPSTLRSSPVQSIILHLITLMNLEEAGHLHPDFVLKDGLLCECHCDARLFILIYKIRHLFVNFGVECHAWYENRVLR